MSSPRSFSFLIPAKTIFVPAWTVSESRRLELQRRSRALDELLRHLQPGVHGLVVPGHVRILEGSGVVVALYLSGLVPEDAVEVGTLLAVAAGVHRVAGAAPVLTTPSMRWSLWRAAAAGARGAQMSRKSSVGCSSARAAAAGALATRAILIRARRREHVSAALSVVPCQTRQETNCCCRRCRHLVLNILAPFADIFYVANSVAVWSSIHFAGQLTTEARPPSESSSYRPMNPSIHALFFNALNSQRQLRRRRRAPWFC